MKSLLVLALLALATATSYAQTEPKEMKADHKAPKKEKHMHHKGDHKAAKHMDKKAEGGKMEAAKEEGKM